MSFGPSRCGAQAKAPASMLEGTVVDPMGARVAHAVVRLRRGDALQVTSTDGSGNFSVDVPSGSYEVTVESPGFEVFHTRAAVTTSAAPRHLRIALSIATVAEELMVDADGAGGTAGGENGSAVVFKGNDLKIFSNDDASFQKQVLALSDGGPRPPQVYVNGFSSGRLPPKSTIASIRFNRNPYSALYDGYGLGRIEITTKPGTDKLHGAFTVDGNDIRFNTTNPYSGAQPPPYYALTLDGNLNGPLDKKTSFFVGGTYNDQQNNAAVDAVTLDNALQQVALAQAVPNPQTTGTYSARIDRQVTANNTFIGSYQYNQVDVTNGGVGVLSLPLQGFNSGTTAQTLQLTDTQVIGMKAISETRFQYVRRRQQQNPVSGATAIVAEGSFNDGGNPQQQLHDNQDNYEFQELFTRQQGPQVLRVGGRYRLYRDANLSRYDYNGQFIFPSLTAYQITKQGVAAGASDAAIRATCEPQPTGPPICGGATEYSITKGVPSANVLTGDLALFAEDEWKVSPNITLDLGFRFESQSGVPDHVDPAPRLGVAWAVHRKKVKAPLVTLRAGVGVFYDRFAAANLLTAIRQNGVTQQTYIENNPDFTNPVVTATPPTIYTLNPDLRSEYGTYAGVSAERVFGRFGRASVTYTGIRGDHQYLSRNINAPLPGTYDPSVPGSGTRPLGGTQNIYQFDSAGLLNDQILSVSGRFQLSKRVVYYLVSSINQLHTDASNAATFVSNSYNPHADYGRYAQPSQTLFTGTILQLPYGVSSNLYFSAQRGTPFNITTGTDLNGDNQYNDRPSFATDLTRASVVKTAFGNFDTAPIAGQKLVPINYGNSPNFVFFDMNLARSFAVGPRPAAPAAAQPGAKSAPRPDPPFSLSFSVDAQNVFNHINPGPPVGVLSSTLFGKPNSLNNSLSTNTAANRLVILEVSFSF